MPRGGYMRSTAIDAGSGHVGASPVATAPWLRSVVSTLLVADIVHTSCRADGLKSINFRTDAEHGARRLACHSRNAALEQRPDTLCGAIQRSIRAAYSRPALAKVRRQGCRRRPP